MTERAIRKSFIVRIYRHDPEHTRMMTGLVEATDGSGVRASFTSIEELGAILNRLVDRKSGKAAVYRTPGDQDPTSR